MADRKYGWQADAPDDRDLIFEPPLRGALPQHVDLSRLLPAAWDQGQLGSCTSFGVAGAIAAARAKQSLAYFEPSHLFIYYNERELEGSVDEDAGAQVRDGIKVVAKQGVCPEAYWPYSDQGMRWRMRPTLQAYSSAVRHQALKYERVQHGHIRATLAAGFPIVFGFQVYESFESEQMAQGGVMPMPKPDEECLGGHCVLACGYSEETRRILVRNSWSPQWGRHGYFTMPFDFINDESQASDFWAVTKLEA